MLHKVACALLFIKSTNESYGTSYIKKSSGTGDYFNAHILKFFRTNIVTHKVLKKLLTSGSLLAPIASFDSCITDNVIKKTLKSTGMNDSTETESLNFHANL